MGRSTDFYNLFKELQSTQEWERDLTSEQKGIIKKEANEIHAGLLKKEVSKQTELTAGESLASALEPEPLKIGSFPENKAIDPDYAIEALGLPMPTPQQAASETVSLVSPKKPSTNFAEQALNQLKTPYVKPVPTQEETGAPDSIYKLENPILRKAQAYLKENRGIVQPVLKTAGAIAGGTAGAMAPADPATRSLMAATMAQGGSELAGKASQFLGIADPPPPPKEYNPNATGIEGGKQALENVSGLTHAYAMLKSPPMFLLNVIADAANSAKGKIEEGKPVSEALAETGKENAVLLAFHGLSKAAPVVAKAVKAHPLLAKYIQMTPGLAGTAMEAPAIAEAAGQVDAKNPLEAVQKMAQVPGLPASAFNAFAMPAADAQRIGIENRSAKIAETVRKMNEGSALIEGRAPEQEQPKTPIVSLPKIEAQSEAHNKELETHDPFIESIIAMEEAGAKPEVIKIAFDNRISQAQDPSYKEHLIKMRDEAINDIMESNQGKSKNEPIPDPIDEKSKALADLSKTIKDNSDPTKQEVPISLFLKRAREAGASSKEIAEATGRTISEEPREPEQKKPIAIEHPDSVPLETLKASVMDLQDGDTLYDPLTGSTLEVRRGISKRTGKEFMVVMSNDGSDIYGIIRNGNVSDSDIINLGNLMHGVGSGVATGGGKIAPPKLEVKKKSAAIGPQPEATITPAKGNIKAEPEIALPAPQSENSKLERRFELARELEKRGLWTVYKKKVKGVGDRLFMKTSEMMEKEIAEYDAKNPGAAEKAKRFIKTPVSDNTASPKDALATKSQWVIDANDRPYLAKKGENLSGMRSGSKIEISELTGVDITTMDSFKKLRKFGSLTKEDEGKIISRGQPKDPVVEAAKPNPASGWVHEKVEGQAKQDPRTLTASDLSIQIEKQHPGVKIDLTGNGDRATLSRLVVPKEMRNSGIGTKIMNQVKAWADSNGISVSLTPSSDFGGNKNRLVGFYKRFGFIENKGKSKDFAITDTMYRLPKKSEPAKKTAPISEIDAGAEALAEKMIKRLGNLKTPNQKSADVLSTMNREPPEVKKMIADKVFDHDPVLYRFIKERSGYDKEYFDRKENLTLKDGPQSTDPYLFSVGKDRFKPVARPEGRFGLAIMDDAGEWETYPGMVAMTKDGVIKKAIGTFKDIEQTEKVKEVSAKIAEELRPIKEKEAAEKAALEKNRITSIKYREAIEEFKLPKANKGIREFPAYAVHKGKKINSKVKVSGDEYGDFLIEKVPAGKKNTYTVHHIPTGMQVKSGLNQTDAKNIVKQFLFSGVDTSFTDTSARSAQKPLKTLLDIIKGYIPETFSPKTDEAASPKKSTRLNSVEYLIAEGIYDAARKGASLIKSGTKDFYQWSKAMMKEYGPKIKGKIVKLWEAAKELASAGITGKRTGALTLREKLGFSTKDPEPKQKTLPPFADRERKPMSDKIKLTAAEKFKMAVQSQLESVEKAQKILGEGKELPEEMDTILQADLSKKRIQNQLEYMDENHYQPLIEDIHKNNVDLKEFEKYLQAKHAGERNLHISTINQKFTKVKKGIGAVRAGSGMDDAQAALWLSKFQAEGKTQRFEDLAKKVYAIAKEQREYLRKYGLLSQDQVNQLNSYKYYVPLKGKPSLVDWTIQDRTAIGQGFDQASKPIKRSLGRWSDPSDIISHLMEQTDATIIRGEKNLVDNAFLNFVEAHPDPSLWKVNEVKTKPVFLEEIQEVVDVPDYSAKFKDNHIVVRRSGQEFDIELADPEMAKGLKNLGEKTPAALKLMMGGMKLLAATKTQLSPEFSFANSFRDGGEAFMNIAADHGIEVAKTVVRETPGSISQVFSYLRGDKKVPLAPYIDEFKRLGGPTGFFDFKTVEERTISVENRLKELSDERKIIPGIKAGGNWVLQYLKDMSEASELGNRVAVFKEMKKVMSPARAAQYAKNVTVNFDRQGTLGPWIKALYMFGNAGIQGTNRIFQTLGSINENTAKGQRVRKLVSSAVIGSALIDSLNSKISDDWDKTEQKFKNNNLIFMLPGGYKVMFPLPYGYAPLHVLGQQISSSLRGKTRPSEAAKNILLSAVDAFNPIGGDSDPRAAWIPSLAKPLAETWANKNEFFGRKITPEQPSFGQAQKPDSQLFWKETSPSLKWATSSLNEITGGNTARPGKIDISPATLEYLADFFTGGLGRTIRQTYDLGLTLKQGKTPQPSSVPIFRRFFGGPDNRADTRIFRENIQELNIYKAEKKIGKANPSDSWKDRLFVDLNGMPKYKVPGLKKRLADLEDQITEESEKGNHQAVESLRDKVADLKKKFNEKYARLSQGQK